MPRWIPGSHLSAREQAEAVLAELQERHVEWEQYTHGATHVTRGNWMFSRVASSQPPGLKIRGFSNGVMDSEWREYGTPERVDWSKIARTDARTTYRLTGTEASHPVGPTTSFTSGTHAKGPNASDRMYPGEQPALTSRAITQVPQDQIIRSDT
ncbi:unnamed protein product [Phytophthora fragariaefolia]|uniref:Unnamed protein product n=1 Tax=Phytophthora fragariaefolia TaxID=1490495 RepID=A0A9W6XU73_9STRA|nr:unnamed protein product [Phytophthora fragariaefolia]